MAALRAFRLVLRPAGRYIRAMIEGWRAVGRWTAGTGRAPAVAACLLAACLVAATPRAAAAAERAVPDTREAIRLSFAPLVKQVGPAVVNIYTKTVVTERRPRTLFDDPMFRRFFGDAFPEMGPRQRVQNSLGSGVIVDAEGLIVTNAHVVKNAEKITVVLADRREFDAETALVDERTDLAVLKVDAGGERLPVATLGDSDELEVGDLVLAIGNPFGVGQTVTSGIVSALARTTVGVSDYAFFIQTDAAINPGNSGGALVDMKGRIVGINTAIYSRNGGGSIGIGFAVPANMVRTVLNAVRSGRVVRPWIGAAGQSVTAEIAQSLGLALPRGVLISEVHAAGPAKAAGLQQGDVILEIDGRDVVDAVGFRYRIGTTEIGSTATLRVWRKGRMVDLRVPLRPPPETPPRDVTRLSGRHPLDGAVAGNLSPAFALELGADDMKTGVILLEIARGSAASRIGLRPGDLVLSVNDRRVARVDELTEALGRARQGWRIAIERDGKVLTAEIQG